MANNAYTLYYTPGACSLSPHIALIEAKVPFELAKVDLRTKKLADGGDWLSINPKGYVPALRFPDGEVLTEGAILVQYIADLNPESKLAPPYGTKERLRLNEWLHFIATELHKGVNPLYNALANDDFKAQLRERIAGRFAVLAAGVRGKPFLMGDRFTIADGYAFYVMRTWIHAIKQDLARWPELADYYQRLAARPSVAAALEAEGLKA
jgi:glutathione S-transferase